MVIQEQQIDVFETICGKPFDRIAAHPNKDFDNIAQAGQVHQGHDDCCKFRISFQAEVALSTGFTQRVTEQQSRISNITTQFNHHLRLDFRDQIGHNLTLVVANVHHELLAAELVDDFQHPSWGATNVVDRRMSIHEVQQFDFAAIVELGCQFSSATILLLMTLDLRILALFPRKLYFG